MSQLRVPTSTSPRRSASGDRVVLPNVRIMGVDFAAVGEDAVVAMFVDGAVAGNGRWIVTANLDHLRRFATEWPTRDLIGQADVVVADGAPIVLASRIAGMPLPERVSGSNMVLPISRRAAATGASVYLLGGEHGVAERAQTVLAEAAPGLRIAGTACPPHGFEHDPAMLAEIERALLDASPDIVLVAMSFPKTDALIERLRQIHPRASYMGVGIALSFITGDKRRAPVWMRVAGIEWLHRLISEPGRLWQRYLVRGLPFAARLAAAAAVARIQLRLGGAWLAQESAQPQPFISSND